MNIIKIVLDVFTSDKVGSVLRHAASAVAGYLLARGIISQGQVTTIIDMLVNLGLPAVMYLLTQLSSFANKKL